MNIEEIRDYALSLTCVTEDQPFGDNSLTFRVGGKIFLCLWLGDGHINGNNSEHRFAIKLSPERNTSLRSTFDSVKPAWHWNKKHWSDVYYECEEDDRVKEWISESHALVVSKLPKILQDVILADINCPT